ncbi:MAG: hypothetical protein NWE98_06415 [Candidatus Bathyarchaeota archaeon]|nr:hypothetical protein [Candidatus Bathyarchaeota archaeon]
MPDLRCTCSTALVEKKNKRYMLPQPQERPFNMEPCMPCGENQDSHTQTQTEKQPKTKKQPSQQIILWQPQNHHTHIKAYEQASFERI